MQSGQKADFCAGYISSYLPVCAEGGELPASGVPSQAPNSEAPFGKFRAGSGAPIFIGCSHFSRRLGHLPILFDQLDQFFAGAAAGAGSGAAAVAAMLVLPM